MGARRRGQGLTEVMLIIALLAIGTLGLVSIFADELKALFGRSSDVLAGAEAGSGPTRGRQPVRKTLRNFGHDPAGGTNGPQ